MASTLASASALASAFASAVASALALALALSALTYLGNMLAHKTVGIGVEVVMAVAAGVVDCSTMVGKLDNTLWGIQLDMEGVPWVGEEVGVEEEAHSILFVGRGQDRALLVALGRFERPESSIVDKLGHKEAEAVVEVERVEEVEK